jgi:hypothetical protein
MMRVEFRKTGARRYAVRAHRLGFPAAEVNPAPGGDRPDLCTLRRVERILVGTLY